jgi:hypothetical protein
MSVTVFFSAAPALCFGAKLNIKTETGNLIIRADDFFDEFPAACPAEGACKPA